MSEHQVPRELPPPLSNHYIVKGGMQENGLLKRSGQARSLRQKRKKEQALDGDCSEHRDSAYY